MVLIAFIFVTFWLFFVATLGLGVYFDDCSNIENATMLAIIIVYLYEQVITINTPFIYRDPYFWIASAYFIYFSGIFFTYIYLDTLSLKEQSDYYALEYVFIIFRSLLLSVAMIIKLPSDNFNTSFHVTQRSPYK